MAQQELKRQIGLFDAVMLIAGDMIGIGIFVTTGVIAETLPTPGGVLLVWVLGGLLALAGALSCAELSASLPYAGGDYIYIREAYGKLVGFLSGWSSFLVTFSGAIAFLAVGFNGFMSFFFPVLGSKEAIFSTCQYRASPSTLRWKRYFSMIVVLLISGLHCLGSAAGHGNAKYSDDSEDRLSLGNYLLGSLVRQRRHGAFQPIFRLGERSGISVFLRRPSYRRFSPIRDGMRSSISPAKSKIRSEICLALCYGQISL